MKPNIGLLNAYVRIACGLTMMAWSTPHLTRSYRSGRHLFCVMMGAMKVAEGITRFCPLTKMISDSFSQKETEYTDSDYTHHASVNMNDL
ncbi:YgaP family membrane protein [Bacillus piscicola]|uniref:YgaP family membrane protein n=1 Tax=Bacillus piscicola TaxID=1632684 RepID=UPI001F08A7C5|nr:DUF2892 domain-containing protein [Bacillus piscicola]